MDYVITLHQVHLFKTTKHWDSFVSHCIVLFDVLDNLDNLENSNTIDGSKISDYNHDEMNGQTNTSTSEQVEDTNHANPDAKPDDHQKVPIKPVKSTDEPRRSTRIPQPSKAILQSKEYQRCEDVGQAEGQEWATTVEQHDYIACLSETKASHNIPHLYRHAMATDPDRWIVGIHPICSAGKLYMSCLSCTFPFTYVSFTD